MNAAFFAIAAARKTDVVTDLSYSLSFAVLAIVLPFAGARETVQLTASLLLLVWAVRLGSYLFRRILRTRVDHRFDEMRDKPLRFARFWLLQAITVAVVMLPVSYLLGRDDAPEAGPWTIAGVALRSTGLLIEAVADAQKSSFKARDENRGRFITSGLWRYSRHPNYFGEMLVWWGLFVLAVPFLDGGGVRRGGRAGVHHPAPPLRERYPAARAKRRGQVRRRPRLPRIQATDEHPRAAATSQLASAALAAAPRLPDERETLSTVRWKNASSSAWSCRSPQAVLSRAHKASDHFHRASDRRRARIRWSGADRPRPFRRPSRSQRVQGRQARPQAARSGEATKA